MPSRSIFVILLIRFIVSLLIRIRCLLIIYPSLWILDLNLNISILVSLDVTEATNLPRLGRGCPVRLVERIEDAAGGLAVGRDLAVRLDMESMVTRREAR